MRFLIVGVGAVGGYIGSRLIDAGADVTFLVHPGKQRALASRGLQLVAKDVHRALPVRTITVDEVRPEYDAVLLAVKAYALDAAIVDLKRIGGDAVIIPTLNGIGHLRSLSDAFPNQVLGGVVLVVTELDADGTIRVIQPGGSLRLGELDGHPTERVEKILTATRGTDLDISASTTIVADMWEKWHFLAAGGALTTLLNADIGRIAATQDGTRTANAIVDEIADIITAAGHPPRTAALDRTRAALTQPDSTFTTSMYRDHIAHRPVEVEAILGDLVALASTHSRPAPLTTAAAVALRIG